MRGHRAFTEDGTIELYSRALITKLVAAGCRPIRELPNGHAVFAKTSTIRHLIREYTTHADQRRAEARRERRPR